MDHAAVFSATDTASRPSLARESSLSPRKTPDKRNLKGFRREPNIHSTLGVTPKVAIDKVHLHPWGYAGKTLAITSNAEIVDLWAQEV